MTVATDCPLSGRELEILRLMAHEGLRTDQIAPRLHLAASTVRSHLHSLYRRLGVASAVQALVVAFNAGWIDPTDTQVQDPTRFEDRKVSDRQRAYLWAFDHHLQAGDDEARLERAKLRTDIAAWDIGKRPASTPDREWMNRLISNMARLGHQRERAS